MKTINYRVYILILFSIFLVSNGSYAQHRGYGILLRGRVSQMTSTSWELSKSCNFYIPEKVAISIDKHGNFSKYVPIQGETQDLIFPNSFTITVKRNDTLDVSWDNDNMIRTLIIKSSNPERNGQLQMLIQHNLRFFKPWIELEKEVVSTQLSDSLKAKKINDLFEAEIYDIFKNSIDGFIYDVAIDIYFRYINLLYADKLLIKFPLQINKQEGIQFFSPCRDPEYYKMENLSALKTSAYYRNFLFDYLRSTKLIKPAPSILQSGNSHIEEQNSPAWNDYYIALACLQNSEVRDWFIANSIAFDFEFYSFKSAEGVYREFTKKGKSNIYIAQLKKIYQRKLALTPGKKAPEFKLKNDDGHYKSISDFRGKVIYLDFWGVYCPPCLTEFKRPTIQLHENFDKRNVVFINICIDADEKKWKETLKRNTVVGVNLIATGKSKDILCKNYKINAIPHYLIIDKNGSIVDNNAPRPSSGFILNDKLEKVIR